MVQTPKSTPANEVVTPRTEDAPGDLSAAPNDADDTSDAGRPTTDHDAEGWRSKGPSTP